MDGTKAAKQLAAERTLKAIETADNLRKEVDAKRESSDALKVQVDMLSKRLQDAKFIGLAVAELFMWVPLSNSEAQRHHCPLSLQRSTSSLG